MFFRRREKEKPLHVAVINNDIDVAMELSKDAENLIEQNALGFTPIELARLLNREEILHIFTPSLDRIIKVVLPDTTKVETLTVGEYEEVFNAKYIDSLHFDNYKQLKLNLINSRIIRFLITPFCKGSLGEAVKLGRELQVELSTGYVVDSVIRWIDNTLGYGLFTEVDLDENTFVGEYTGHVRKVNRLLSDTNEYCFQYPNRWWSFKYLVIDALNEGNILRFVNHSEIPNLRFACVIDRGLVHVAMMTSRKIRKGEQLTIDYGKDYWQRRLQKVFPEG